MDVMKMYIYLYVFRTAMLQALLSKLIAAGSGQNDDESLNNSIICVRNSIDADRERSRPFFEDFGMPSIEPGTMRSHLPVSDKHRMCNELYAVGQEDLLMLVRRHKEYLRCSDDFPLPLTKWYTASLDSTGVKGRVFLVNFSSIGLGIPQPGRLQHMLGKMRPVILKGLRVEEQINPLRVEPKL